MLNDIFKAVGPIMAAALAEKVGKADGATFRFSGREYGWDGEDVGGVPLDNLDLTQEAPSRVSLGGSARLRIVESDVWRISASGPGAESLRFILRDGQLSILPVRGSSGESQPEVDLAIPAPRALSISGSGSIETQRLAPEAALSVFGSGRILARSVKAERLKAVIAGSGAIEAEGHVERLKLSVTGSGSANLRALKANHARIALTGSGHAELSSDGEVTAKLMGSGNVTIYGSPRCRVNGMGSGHLQVVPHGQETAQEAPPSEPSISSSDDQND